LKRVGRKRTVSFRVADTKRSPLPMKTADTPGKPHGPAHGHTGDRCRNCDASLAHAPPPRFCPACGQETALHPPTLFEFLHEFVAHYVALEGALWRTLGLLLLKPGRLTTEYFAGRRRRYVLPLRIYLSASFVFFLLVKVLGAGSPVDVQVRVGEPAPAASAPAASAPAASSASASAESDQEADGPELRRCETSPNDCGWLESKAAGVVARARSDPGFGSAATSRAVSMAPYAVFALLPVFAGIVMLAFRKQRMSYGGHFVFSMHMHAFWFIALLLVAVLPKALSDLVFLAIPVYGVWALRTVYAENWGPTLWKALLISVMYAIVLNTASVTIAGIAIATG
jgi:hypothetical protein